MREYLAMNKYINIFKLKNRKMLVLFIDFLYLICFSKISVSERLTAVSKKLKPVSADTRKPDNLQTLVGIYTILFLPEPVSIFPQQYPL